MLKKLLLDIRLFFHGIFYCLRSADDVISKKASYGSGEVEISQEKEVDGVFSDFIKGEETQQVKETRDEYYRTFRESDSYHTDITNFGKENEDFKTVTRKKTAIDFSIKIEVYNPEKLPIRVIQDNHFIRDGVSNFRIKRDFIPRFNIEHYANKVVVREINKNYVYVDFYTTMFASQFGKVDAIYISKLNEILQDKEKNKDITDFSELDFITDKAFGEKDLFEYCFKQNEFCGIHIFDGNFVLTYKMEIIKYGYDVTEKYKTKELDEKLKKNEVRDRIKKNGVDIFTLNRHINNEKENTKQDF